MRFRLFKILACLLLFVPNLSAVVVRVLLDTKLVADTKPWHIASPDGLRFYDTADTRRRLKSLKSEIQALVKQGRLYLDDACLLRDSVTIEPVKGRLKVDGQEYDGIMRIVWDINKVYLINILDLEDYVSSVVRSEGWPGWPLEIYKVMAIVCRTYVIAKLMEAAKTVKSFDIVNTNKHQTYRGWHDRRTEREAVEQTRGMFLAYDGQPIIAMFDACCGGIVPAQTVGVIDFGKAPYLARTYACDYCKHYPKVYSWQVALPLKELERMITQAHDISVGALQGAHISKRDDAGLVKEITFKSARRRFALSAKHLYSLIKEVKSYCFSIARRGSQIILKGRGFGHHIGLCQWGARRMVDEGWDYRSILQFYYPLTTFMKLEMVAQEAAVMPEK